MKQRQVFLAIAIAALAAMMGSMSGCSGSDESGLTSVRILIDWKAEPTYAGFYIAKEKGFFKKHGLDVEIVEGSGATTSAQVIGSTDEYLMGSCSGAATAIARSREVPIKSLAVLYPSIPTVLYSRGDSPINVPADMIGRKIGLISGSISVDEYRGVLAANNLTSDQIEEVSVGWDVAPLLAGQVDGLMNYEELTPVELRLQGHDIAVMRFRDHGVQAYSLNLIASEESLERNRELIEKATRAIIEGYVYLRENPGDAVEVFSALRPEKSKGYIEQSIPIVSGLLGEGIVGEQSIEGWETTLETLSSLGLLDSPVSLSSVIAEGF